MPLSRGTFIGCTIAMLPCSFPPFKNFRNATREPRHEVQNRRYVGTAA